MATGGVGRMVVDLLVDAGVPVRVLTHRYRGGFSALQANVEVVTGDSPCPTRSTQGCVCRFRVPLWPPRRRLLRPWSSVWHPMRGVSSFSHHRTRRRTLSSGNRIRWRCSTPILSGSSRPPGSSRRSSGRGCSRRTRCGRPRFAPAVSSGGLTALPRQHPVDDRDVAAVAARTLYQDGHAGGDYVLRGPESLSQAVVPASGRRFRADLPEPPNKYGRRCRCRRHRAGPCPGRVSAVGIPAWSTDNRPARLSAAGFAPGSQPACASWPTSWHVGRVSRLIREYAQVV